MSDKRAYLVLSNGQVFSGHSFGAEAEAVGEVVFTTGMVGYIETLTDPSYAGQIVTQTFPLIGNYGIIPDDFEGVPALAGYVVREVCGEPSNFRSEGTVDAFLKERGIPGLYGVDTREITRILREEGVMAGIITSDPKYDVSKLAGFAIRGAVERVTCAHKTVVLADGEKRHSVTLIDYGEKRNIVRNLTARGCEVTIVPAHTTADEILASEPDGVMLSNGPGDPAENTSCIEEIKHLIGKVPLFGICLGHQLTALAMGGETTKLKYGHRGANQPVHDMRGTRTYITSQNHGYAVVASSVEGRGVEIFRNSNDGSNEGIEYEDQMCFTVQFHPEACAGPMDTTFLFDKFVAMMGGGTVAKG